MKYDPFIKRELATRTSLQGLMWCKLGHNTPESGPNETFQRGYLTHKKQPPPKGPPQGPRHIPVVGSYGWGVSDERGTPVLHRVDTGAL